MRSEYQKTINKLDRVFSEYIRRRDSDVLGRVHCITCGKVMPWKEAHCGHYISRRFMPTRYDEHNCHPQCPSCNTFKEGAHFIYRQRLVERYGEKAVVTMEALAQTPKSHNTESLKYLLKEYTETLKALKEAREEI